MADIERLFLSSVITEGTLIPTLEAKITPEFLEDDMYFEIFDWVLDFYQRYGCVPSAPTVTKKYPDFEIGETPEPAEFYLDEVRKRRRFGLMAEAVKHSAKVLNDEEDPDKAISLLSTAIAQTESETNTLSDTDINAEWAPRIERYESVKDNKGVLTGLPWGVVALDQATGGILPEQLVVVAGVPKAGKSLFLMQIAIAMINFGKSVVMVSFEMSEVENTARHDGMVAHLDSNKILQGRLSLKESAHLAKTLEGRASLPPFTMSTDISSVTTVGGLAAKIEQHKPDCLIVDGAYLMQDEQGEDVGSPQALTNITRSFKRLAQRTKVPIVISTQVLFSRYSAKKGIQAQGIGYSSSFAQDANHLIGVEGDEEDPSLGKISIVISRTAPKMSVGIYKDFSTSTFTEMEVGDDDDTI